MPTILQRIAAGDQTAVRECVDEYGGLAWRLGWRYLGHEQSEIEDAVQEAFVEVWLAARRFDPSQGSEPAFVSTIIHRRLIDYQRRRMSRGREGVGSGFDGALTDGVPVSICDAVQRAEAKPVAEAFDRLPPDEREALWLSIHGGFSHSQIATATSAPLGTVKSRIRRGLLKMYDALMPSHGDSREVRGSEHGKEVGR
jgi:RNA polymerase sigma factor (sigma-70 family)